MRLIVGVTGSSGVIYAVRLIETLAMFPDAEVHLVMSDWALANLHIETTNTLDDLSKFVHQIHENQDLSSCIASGSFKTDGMIILPCSMKTLSSIANGYADTLISRAADVCLKEGRKLVLSPRESPLSAIHLENMLKLSRLGVRMVPPMPAFYNHPSSIEDLVDHHVMKILDQFNLESPYAKRWEGPHLKG